MAPISFRLIEIEALQPKSPVRGGSSNVSTNPTPNPSAQPRQGHLQHQRQGPASHLTPFSTTPRRTSPGLTLQHPGGSEVAFGDVTTEDNFFILADLLPPPPLPPNPAVPQPVLMSDTPVSRAQIKIPLSYTPVQVISDIAW